MDGLSLCGAMGSLLLCGSILGLSLCGPKSWKWLLLCDSERAAVRGSPLALYLIFLAACTRRVLEETCM